MKTIPALPPVAVDWLESGRWVHAASGAICVYCGFGGGPQVKFEEWLHLRSGHVIPKALGGGFRQISRAVSARFSELPLRDRRALAIELARSNRVTACGWCEYVGDRLAVSPDLGTLIRNAPGDVEAVKAAVLDAIESTKGRRADQTRSIREAVRREFERSVQRQLERTRTS